jgi:hypothetical protein
MLKQENMLIILSARRKTELDYVVLANWQERGFTDLQTSFDVTALSKACPLNSVSWILQ